MVVGFITIYAISAYLHRYYEFESRSGRGVKHYVIKFISDLRQVGGFLRVHRFPPPIKPPRYNWNIVENVLKHHQTKKTQCTSTFCIYKTSDIWMQKSNVDVHTQWEFFFLKMLLTHKAVYIYSLIPGWFIQTRLGDNWKISYVC
jgi:hypothetical protein